MGVLLIMRKQYLVQPTKGVWTRPTILSIERFKPSSPPISQMTRQGNPAIPVSRNIRMNSIKKDSNK